MHTPPLWKYFMNYNLYYVKYINVISIRKGLLLSCNCCELFQSPPQYAPPLIQSAILTECKSDDIEPELKTKPNDPLHPMETEILLDTNRV